MTMKRSFDPDRFIIIVFALLISLGIVGALLVSEKEPLNVENRKLAEYPQMPKGIDSLKRYPSDLKNYFNDHFGFRNAFIKMNFYIRYKIMRESPTNRVVLGKNDWLFYTNDRAMDDYRGITRFDDGKLEEIAKIYQDKKDYLAKKGIRYLLVLVPNKETIYGEWMPDSMYKIRTRSGMDEITEYLEKNTSVDFLDLRDVLLENKGKEQLFLKTSSNWNDYGAFLGYQEIMKIVSEWFPEARPDSLSGFRVVRREVPGDDLARMMGGAHHFREQDIFLVPAEARKARKIYTDTGAPITYKTYFAMIQDRDDLPRALVFRDCFFDKIIPFLSEKFEYSKYYYQSWNPDTPMDKMIGKIRPDIVIEEKVERFLKYAESP